MKPLMIAACIVGFSLLPLVSWAQQGCHAIVKTSVEVAGDEFSLADLLAGDSCPELLRTASRVRLGSAPLAGSMRVLEADDIRTSLKKVAGSMYRGESLTMVVPERVSVRRAGARASCADIGRRILTSLDARPTVAESGPPNAARPQADTVVPHDLECGAAGRIPQGAPVELTKTVWDPTLDSWETSVRCTHPSDCVPFLVRLGNRTSEPEIARSGRRIVTSSSPFARGTLSPARGRPLVRPGETVTLLWDQDGIRVVVPAICLDPGDKGQKVRARIVRGGRLVRAIVVNAGELRIVS